MGSLQYTFFESSGSTYTDKHVLQGLHPTHLLKTASTELQCRADTLHTVFMFI